MRTAVAQGVSQGARRLGRTLAARPGQGLTVGALEAVRALDLGVPQELAIVGFNDSATRG